MKKSEIETYLMLLKHEMFAEDVKTVDKEFIEQIVSRAGRKLYNGRALC